MSFDFKSLLFPGCLITAGDKDEDGNDYIYAVTCVKTDEYTSWNGCDGIAFSPHDDYSINRQFTADSGEVYPVKITDDLLLEYGFVKAPISMHIDISRFPTERRWLVIDMIGGNYAMLRYNEDKNDSLANDEITILNDKVRFMHEVQIIYAALTFKHLSYVGGESAP